MENITLERLLKNFTGVIDQIKDIIDRKDIEQAIEALKQIEELVENDQHVTLDEGVEESYDHVLHKLLTKIRDEIKETEITREVESESQEGQGRSGQDSSNTNGSDGENNSQNTDEQRNILFEGESDGTELMSPEKLFEKSTGTKWDPDKYEIEWEGVDDYGYDNPIYSFRVVRKMDRDGEFQQSQGTGSQQQNDGTSNLQSILDRLKEEEKDIRRQYDAIPNLTQGKQELEVKLSEKKAQITGLENIIHDLGSNGDYDLNELLRRLKSEKEALDQEYISITQNKEGKVIRGPYQTSQEKLVESTRKGAEIRALEKIIADIENGRGGRDGRTHSVTDRLDLAEEASRIGDYIFKTAEIRKALLGRGVTRDDFIEFYEAGKERSQEELQELNKSVNEVLDEVGTITNSDSGKSLQRQLQDCDSIKDENKKKAEKIRILEEIRRNFIRSGKYEESLKKIGFFDVEITTVEQADKFYDRLFKPFMENAQDSFNSYNKQLEECRENIEIFEKEIDRIRAEKEFIEITQVNLKSLEADAEKEKTLRAEQIRATILGDPELEEKWNKRVERFYKHRIAKTDKKDSNGRIIEYLTIEDYDEYEEDAHYLNLDDYRKNLEITTLYENSGRNIDFILTELDPATVEQYKQKEKEKQGSGKKWLEDYLAEKAEYVSSFHGFTNEHEVKYSIYKTAGSSLKAMKPVKGDLPATTKVGNAIGNTFRFLGLRKPEFKRIDENGNEVSNKVGGLLTLATDALVIGGMAAAALTGPIGWATAGSAYAVRGGVLAGNRIAARRYYKKHGTEIDQNLPTLGHPSKDDKEVARKDYYRRIEGKNRFTSWLKSKNDRFFFRKRAKETEERIVQERVELSNAVIDRRTEEAKRQAENNLETAERNQSVRQENTRKVIRGQEFYNDVVRDPNSVDRGFAFAEAARTAAVRSHRAGASAHDVNPNSNQERIQKYQREGEQFEQTNDLKSVKTKGGTISATAVTREEKYTARQQKQDRINKVLTVVGTALTRIGVEGFVNGFNKKITVSKQGPSKHIPGKTTQKPVYRTETVKSLDGNRSISDFEYSDDALNDVWNLPNNTVHTHYVRGDDPIRSIALRARCADGTIKEVSIAQAGYGFIKDRHVDDIIDQDISGLSLTDTLDLMKARNPHLFDEYCKAVGLQGTSTEEIAKNAIENGNLFGQTDKLAGWAPMLKSNLTSKTRQVLDHMQTVTVPAKTIPGQVVTTTNTVFSPDAVLNATALGAAGGVGYAVSDQLHEAANQTKRVEPGTFELFSRIAAKAQDDFNKRRGERGGNVPEPTPEPVPVPGADPDQTVVNGTLNEKQLREYRKYFKGCIKDKIEPMKFKEWFEKQRKQRNTEDGMER